MIRNSAEDMYNKAEDQYKNVPKEEIVSWAKHPLLFSTSTQ